VKLNLGCGWETIPGHEGMDLRTPSSATIIGDIVDLSRFQDNSIEAIVSHHSLEHQSYNSIPSVLKEWYRVLVPGGRVEIFVPEVGEIVADDLDFSKFNKCVFGETDEKYWNQKQDFHKTLFRKRDLNALLLEAGFHDLVWFERRQAIEPEVGVVAVK